MNTLFDMHCHLGFAPDPARTARDGAAAGIAVLSCTVEPSEYERLRPLLADCGNAALGLGAHPWRVADGRIGEQELEAFCALAPGVPYIGEIGLDFARERSNDESRRLQVDAFERMLRACNEAPGKLLSVHAVQAADTALDLLEQTGAVAEHRIIFHWFSGTSDDLARALRLGCFFSVGPCMLASRRGREYARQIPLERLVLETDLPARDGEPLPANVWHAELNNALTGIAQLKGLAPDKLAEHLAATSETLLAMPL
ncbi:TatD family hydrolase [uncultured Adlercreutzia sp.]|uniref:TatD family hydrolase n=1 Tax=uncultured Adlercreutzia sp. TaxID=875803 RepID=UPI0025D3BBB7|nr:TatD family hydrolase [uncultured Adlercreutzia sp.]